MRRDARAGVGAGLAVALALLLPGCSGRPAPGTVVRWCAGHAAPRFDPDGPPDALRFALEHALSCGLVERDSSGAIRMGAAEAVTVAPDGRSLTFRLRGGLRFTDGTPATSADFRDALLGGLAREDHSTRAWLLSFVTGVSKVRAGRPLPPVGIETPDSRTVILRLGAPQPRLLERLASPGVGVPWKRRAASASWKDAVGIGPYRVARELPGRELDLVRADSGCARRALADTLALRFVIGAPRVRTLLRHAAVDLVWPEPPGLLEQPLPPGYVPGRLAANPARWLLLVLRADVPPTTRLPARHALVHSLNHEELLAALGLREPGSREWLEGAGAFDFPRLDARETQAWLARGKLGASFHVTLAYDADGAGALIARAMQGQWARLGLYAELRPLRGADAAAEPLRASAAQAQLVEASAPVAGAVAEMSTLVMPLRGPAVGSFRTGWRTREFDRWLFVAPPAAGLPVEAAQQRLAEERIALPLATIGWSWVARPGFAAVRSDPGIGVDFSAPAAPAAQSH